MAKNIGILIDPETGDLQIDPRRNDQNVYVQGLQVGEVTIQNQAAILQAMKGELKEYPTLGVGITNIANDHETTGWAREITAQLKADGMRVNDVEHGAETRYRHDDNQRGVCRAGTGGR